MLILRLKQAEIAIADGRLDEAFDIVISEQVREHSRGQKLIGKLARAFAKRGWDNLNNERIQLALADCNKAEKLAGNIEEVAALRSQICSEMGQKRIRDKNRSMDIALAGEQIQNGWLSAGEKILEQTLQKDSQAEIVLQQAAAIRVKISEALAKTEQALKNNCLEEAIDIIQEAHISKCRNDKVAELISRLKLLAVGQVRENFEKGQIDIAQKLWQKISKIIDYSSDISDLGTMLRNTRLAAEHIASGRLHEAIVKLKQVQNICPSAKWLGTILSQSKQAAELLDELASSPLGLSVSGVSQLDDDYRSQSEGEIPLSANQKPALSGIPNIYKQHPQEDITLSSQFILQIDGVGGFLVVRDNYVSIGPVSSSARPAIGLLAPPNLPVAAIERIDDDYFIRSSGTFYVNESSTVEKLLVDGDSIALSSRCRMKFNIPNKASTTATINLSGARLPQADIRQIILMNSDILIGPSELDHIRTESGDDTIMLYFHNGLLLCKTDNKITVNGESVDESRGLEINKPIRIGNISFVITEIR